MLLLLLLLPLCTDLCSESDFMETAQTSGVWLASCLDICQNELIRDSESSCSGRRECCFFLDLYTPAPNPGAGQCEDGG